MTLSDLGPTAQSDVLAVPPGVIVMWAGTLATIPKGWNLCDGTNGTPDLRSKFIKGSAAGVDPGVTGGAASASYTPAGTNSAPSISGSTASESSHTHSVTSNVAVSDHSSHTHQVTAAGTVSAIAATATAAKLGGTSIGNNVSDNAHTHPAPTFTGSAVASGNESAALSHSVTNNAVTSGAGSSHSHGAGTLAASAPTFTGTPATIATEPAYYSLAYIQKS